MVKLPRNLIPVEQRLMKRLNEAKLELAECRAKLAEEQESHHQNLGKCQEHVKELKANCERLREALEAVAIGTIAAISTAEEFAHWPDDKRVWIDMVRAALAGKELET